MDVSLLVDRLLEKDPSKRLPSAANLVESIRSIETALTNNPTLEIPLPVNSEIPQTILQSPNRRVWKFVIPFFVIVALGILFIFGYGIDKSDKENEKRIDDSSITENPITATAFRLHHLAKINERQTEDKGLIIGDTSFEARLGDQLEFEIEFNRSLYAYLIAFRPDRVMEMIYPDAETTPPPKNDRIRYPKSNKRDEVRYGLSEGTGLWGFAVAASDESLPSFSEWSEKTPAYWGQYPSRSNRVYLFDGIEMRIYPERESLRAKDAPALDASTPFEKTLKSLQRKSRTTFVYGLAFVVTR